MLAPSGVDSQSADDGLGHRNGDLPLALADLDGNSAACTSTLVSRGAKIWIIRLVCQKARAASERGATPQRREPPHPRTRALRNGHRAGPTQASAASLGHRCRRCHRALTPSPQGAVERIPPKAACRSGARARRSARAGILGRKRREPGGLADYRPAHYPGGSGEHRGTCRAETVEQGASDKEEHHYLGCDR